jgi:uncharacterized membrane protein
MPPASSTRPRSFAISANIWVLRFTRHWLAIVMVILGLYATLPWVAPTLMKLGATGPANVLYTLYSPMCHQFAFRSIFLFGEQPFYPREIAGTAFGSYESYASATAGLPIGDQPTDFDLAFVLPARGFTGNEVMGYKTALCARDSAIYLALLAGGGLYAILRWRIRPIPYWLFIVMGLLPIGIDGMSQLLSYPPFNLWDVRESPPLLRVLTGLQFGLAAAWLGFPHLERAMWDTRLQIEAKLVRIGIDVG